MDSQCYELRFFWGFPPRFYGKIPVFEDCPLSCPSRLPSPWDWFYAPCVPDLLPGELVIPAELLLKIGCGLWIVGKFSTFGEVRTRTISSLPPSFGLVPLVYSDTRSLFLWSLGFWG